MTANSTFEALVDPRRYALELDRLHAKCHGHRRMHTLTQDGVPLADLMFAPGRLARLLAEAVRSGQYEPSPARVKRVVLDKPRDLFSFEALDFVVHAVLGQLLTERIEPLLSPQLYSYRRGLSSWRTVRDLAAYVRGQRALSTEKRGLYVLRCDVQAYGDSVPLGPSSPLWGLVHHALGLTPADPATRLVERIIRPEIREQDGSRWVCRRGLPLGSPVTTPLENLYLCALDHELAGGEGSFYARFGDDILFAHPDPDVVRTALATTRSFLLGRGLRLNDAKLRLLYWTGAGRRSQRWPEAAGTTRVVYLGMETQFDGTLRLPPAKAREVLGNVRARVNRSDRLLRGTGRPAREEALCRIVGEALDVRSAFQITHADLLHGLVTDRRQLAELDYLFALAIAEQVSGRRGPRAFRDVPWRRLRREHGLVSLVALRNAGLG